MTKRQGCAGQTRSRCGTATNEALDQHNFNRQNHGMQFLCDVPATAQYFFLRDTQHIHDRNRIEFFSR
jgi:hypothetical protein